MGNTEETQVVADVELDEEQRRLFFPRHRFNHFRPRRFRHRPRHFGKFGKFGHFGRRRAEETDEVAEESDMDWESDMDSVDWEIEEYDGEDVDEDYELDFDEADVDADAESDRRRLHFFSHRPRHFRPRFHHRPRHFGKFGKFGHFGRRRAEGTMDAETIIE